MDTLAFTLVLLWLTFTALFLCLGYFLSRVDKLKRTNADLTRQVASSKETAVEMAQWVIVAERHGIGVASITLERARLLIPETEP